ncbi:DUF305 domain-containing protein, partial [Micromonospora purpureochromogenes]
LMPMHRLSATMEVSSSLALRRLLGRHQQEAADLARAHVATATSPRVRELARRVEQSRTAEVRLLTGPAGR